MQRLKSSPELVLVAATIASWRCPLPLALRTLTLRAREMLLTSEPGWHRTATVCAVHTVAMVRADKCTIDVITKATIEVFAEINLDGPACCWNQTFECLDDLQRSSSDSKTSHLGKDTCATTSLPALQTSVTNLWAKVRPILITKCLGGFKDDALPHVVRSRFVIRVQQHRSRGRSVTWRLPWDS